MSHLNATTVQLFTQVTVPPPPYPPICRDLSTIWAGAPTQSKYVRVIARKKSQNKKYNMQRFKTGDLVRYNDHIETYDISIVTSPNGMGLVIAQRKVDVIVYSISEGKEILVRAGALTLLSEAKSV